MVRPKIKLKTKEVELLRLYKVIKTNIKTGEEKEINKYPEELIHDDEERFDYDCKELSFHETGVIDGELIDATQFVKFYNSIPNKEEYDKIELKITSSWDGQIYYPCLVGYRSETANELVERINKEEKERAAKEKRKEAKKRDENK